MKIVIGSDKSGYKLKEAVKDYLIGKGHTVDDRGTVNIDNYMPYYEAAANVANLISKNEYSKGILICGTGAGMCIVANKYKGVYAVCAEGVYTAKMAGIINNANILTLGAWVVAPEMAYNMVDSFIEARFTEGFPPDRKAFLENAYLKVKEIEKG